MKRILRSFLIAALLWLGSASLADAQVWVRAPFVRVGVGPGVYVRAPFVNLYVPTGDRYYYAGPGIYTPGAYGPGIIYGEPRGMPPADGFAPPRVDGFTAPPPTSVPTPKIIERPPALPREKELPKSLPEAPDDLPPAKVAGGALSVDDFVKTFKPRGGSYELELINPVTKAPTTVRFTLPEGMPKSVEYRGNTVEFRYGPRSFVRIEFDKDGALVTTR